MILACPNCAARFRVPDDALGDAGRSVRCGNCGHSWLQRPRQAVLELNPRFPKTAKRMRQSFAGDDGVDMPAAPARGRGRFEEPPPPPPPIAAPPPPPPPPPPPKATIFDEEPPSPASFESAMKAAMETPEPLASSDMPPLMAEKAEPMAAAEKAPRRSIAAAIGWMLFALTTSLLGVGIFAQAEIMARFPETRAIYQALQFPVPQPGEGLELVAPATARGVADGAPALLITGQVRNASDLPRNVPAMRAVLRDANGAEVAGWEFAAETARLEPGALTAFATQLPNPPAGASQLQIVFLDKY